VGTIVKQYDTIVVSGFRGYEPRWKRCHQTEASFMKATGPEHMLIGKPQESVSGILFPPISLDARGVSEYHFKQAVPVTVCMIVVFGDPSYIDI